MIPFVLVILFLLLCASPAYAAAYTPQNTEYADMLNDLGLFAGTDKGYELDRPVSRIEALVMLIRLLGKEAEAKSTAQTHPFTDVPSWADPYVAYAYQEGLSRGVADDENAGVHLYGTGDASSQMYITFILRALGYSDVTGDFRWDRAFEKAAEIGLIGPEEYNEAGAVFYRDDTVKVSFSALTIELKGSETTLAESLVEANAISVTTARILGVITDNTNHAGRVKIPITLKNGSYSTTADEIRSVLPSAAHWSRNSTNGTYNDILDHHIINSSYFKYLLDNAYVYSDDDQTNPFARELHEGPSISFDNVFKDSLVIFDEKNHVCAYGYGNMITQDEQGNYYYLLNKCDYDLSGLLAG
jgi:hypothetical protein